MQIVVFSATYELSRALRDFFWSQHVEAILPHVAERAKIRGDWSVAYTYS